MHYTSREKVEAELGWQTMKHRADYLGLSLYHKIHFNNTRPLIKNSLPVINTRENDLRSKIVYVEFPFMGTKTEIVFFSYMTRLWNRLQKDVKSKSVDEFNLYIQKR